MLRVSVCVVHEVGVTGVLERLVSTGVTVLMRMIIVGGVRLRLVLVPVVLVLVMGMAVVQVVDVALVLNGGVPALRGVGMAMRVVHSVLGGGGHRSSVLSVTC